MTEPFETQDNHTSSDPAIAHKQALWAWLDTPPSSNAAYELSLLQTHLGTIKSLRNEATEHALLLDRFFPRVASILSLLVPGLIGASLPIHRKTRQLVRTLHSILGDSADELTVSIGHAIRQTSPHLTPSPELLLWRQMFALSQHLLISYLTASPAAKGIWLQLHQSFTRARNLQLHECHPEDSRQSLQKLYLSTILLGCAQPATFTSSEISLVAALLELFTDDIEPPNYGKLKVGATFWIDPERDEPAIAIARKPPPADYPSYLLSCEKLSSLLEDKQTFLESGSSTRELGLPEFAKTPSGKGVIRRLIKHWGQPGKRRFPRRSQNYRVSLCSGLEALWHLFRDGNAESLETSSWMVTNESPDGYALMHVSGKTGSLSVGDVIAIKTDSGDNWQTTIVRWAISENQEHLEIGLQLLATQASAALLALPKKGRRTKPLPVLLLPQVPVLRPDELLVVPSGTFENQEETFVLLVEKENLSIREIRGSHLDEQNSQIEIFSFRSETLRP